MRTRKLTDVCNDASGIRNERPKFLAMLDALCQWMISKSKVFTCKENFDINLLMEYDEQSSHLMDVILDHVDNESETTIKYLASM